jgi:hypothetical protein
VRRREGEAAAGGELREEEEEERLVDPRQSHRGPLSSTPYSQPFSLALKQSPWIWMRWQEEEKVVVVVVVVEEDRQSRWK